MSGRFLKIGGGSRAIHLVGNDFSATSVPVSYASEDLRGTVALEGNLPPRLEPSPRPGLYSGDHPPRP